MTVVISALIVAVVSVRLTLMFIIFWRSLSLLIIFASVVLYVVIAAIVIGMAAFGLRFTLICHRFGITILL